MRAAIEKLKNLFYKKDFHFFISHFHSNTCEYIRQSPKYHEKREKIEQQFALLTILLISHE